MPRGFEGRMRWRWQTDVYVVITWTKAAMHSSLWSALFRTVSLGDATDRTTYQTSWILAMVYLMINTSHLANNSSVWDCTKQMAEVCTRCLESCYTQHGLWLTFCVPLKCYLNEIQRMIYSTSNPHPTPSPHTQNSISHWCSISRHQTGPVI